MRRLSTTGQRNLAVILLTVAGIGSWMLLDRQREAGTAPADQAASPDSYFHAMELTRYDANGRPAIEIDAVSALHYPEATDIRLTELNARGRREDGSWTLTANTGLLATDANRLHVEESVELRQQQAGRVALELFTEVLDMDAEREIIETAAAVEIHYGNSSISGTGLWASLTDNHLIIESDVKARYEQ